MKKAAFLLMLLSALLLCSCAAAFAPPQFHADELMVSYTDVTYLYEDSAQSSFGFGVDKGSRYSAKVSVYMESGEKIYESGAIDAGYYIENATLERQIKQGDYKCYLMIDALDPQTLIEIGQIGKQMLLVVASESGL